MARYLYISDAADGKSRAAELGCGWMPSVPAEFASIATAPCAIVAGAGMVFALPEPVTEAQVVTVAEPIVLAEEALDAENAARSLVASVLKTRAQQALVQNSASLALPDPRPDNDTYLAQPAIPANPTLAQLTSAVRVIRNQVDALSRQNNEIVGITRDLLRQNNALIRLAQNLLDSTDDT